MGSGTSQTGCMSSPAIFPSQARRAFLARSGMGLGSLALASLFERSGFGAGGAATSISRGVINPLHVVPKAKRVIFLYMSGGPSHLETFDFKPELKRRGGEPMPESVTKGQPIAQLQGKSQLKILPPLFEFKKHGQSGQEISSALPHIASIADDICIVKSMVTEAINHDPAHTFMNTGTTISGRPSMGSWITYGLGSDAEDLPGFVVLTSAGKGGQMQPIASRQWSAGFLPSKYQGVHLRGQGDPVLYLSRPKGVGPQEQRDVVDAVQSLNRIRNTVAEDPEIATRISQYEMAFLMQSSVPELMEISKEPASVLEMYLSLIH